MSSSQPPSTDPRAAPVRVRVLQLGRRVMSYTGVAGLTVQDALDGVGLTAATGLDVRVNGAAATGTVLLEDGDVLTLIPRIKGGCPAG